VPSLLVRSGSNWVPEKGIYVMQGGSWQRKMGYVYVNGQWVPLSSGVIYMEGYEAVPLSGYAMGSGSYARRGPTALEMFAVAPLIAWNLSWFTTVNLIDLTPYSQVRIRWMNAGYDHSSNRSLLRVLNSNFVIIRELTRTGAFDWREDSLNISDLTGPYYLRVQVNASTVNSHLFVSQWYLV